MREKLAEVEGKRSSWTGEFMKHGSKPGYRNHPPQPTLLLVHVKDSLGREVTDHLWLNQTKEFEALALIPGTIVVFEARVASYQKGYRGHRDIDAPPPSTDFRLSHPTNVRIFAAAPVVSSEWTPEARAAPTEPAKQLGLFS